MHKNPGEIEIRGCGTKHSDIPYGPEARKISTSVRGGRLRAGDPGDPNPLRTDPGRALHWVAFI